jgi:hypothetical protein
MTPSRGKTRRMHRVETRRPIMIGAYFATWKVEMLVSVSAMSAANFPVSEAAALPPGELGDE